MLEKFLALIERIADALEVIAAAKTGNDAPRTPATATTTATTTTATDDKAAKAAEAKAAKEKADKAKAEKAAKEKAAAEKAKAAADPLDPLAAADDDGDPLGGGAEEKKDYTEKEVRDILAKVIDQDGRAAAFAILKEKGGGAKAFTELKKEHYEDVYVACQDRLG